jgi:RNA polymerase-binding transcription factor DksA
LKLKPDKISMRRIFISYRHIRRYPIIPLIGESKGGQLWILKNLHLGTGLKRSRNRKEQCFQSDGKKHKLGMLTRFHRSVRKSTGYQDFIDMVRDQGDYALAELKESTVFSFIELKYQELEKIEQALTRIESGTYGHCMACGGWIGGARLEVMPAAVRCRKCQEEVEKFDGI